MHRCRAPGRAATVRWHAPSRKARFATAPAAYLPTRRDKA